MSRCPDPPSPVREDFVRVALALLALAGVAMSLEACSAALYLPYGLLSAPVLHSDETRDDD